MEEENKTLLSNIEEEDDKIVVDLTPGTKKETKIETKLETKKQETKEKKPRNYKLKVRLEGEPSTSTKPIEPSPKPIEVAPEQEQKQKRAPPKRKQTEQEVKPVEPPPPPPPKEEIKEKIRVVKLVKCDKCGKSITSKSLKYSHKCGEEKVIINQPKTTTTIEYEIEASTPKANIQPPELNTRVLQRIKEKNKGFLNELKTLF